MFFQALRRAYLTSFLHLVQSNTDSGKDKRLERSSSSPFRDQFFGTGSLFSELQILAMLQRICSVRVSLPLQPKANLTECLKGFAQIND
jgi:hypothetical protein